VAQRSRRRFPHLQQKPQHVRVVAPGEVLHCVQHVKRGCSCVWVFALFFLPVQHLRQAGHWGLAASRRMRKQVRVRARGCSSVSSCITFRCCSFLSLSIIGSSVGRTQKCKPHSRSICPALRAFACCSAQLHGV